jgi:hypothetical protein
MKDRHIAQLETRLESLIEGAFAHFFGRKLRAQDIALQLARAMENGLRASGTSDPRPVAPDYYEIRVNADTAHHLTHHQPDLTTLLSGHMVDLATHANYRLDASPVIEIVSDNEMAAGKITVWARHLSAGGQSTNTMQKVAIPVPDNKPKDAQLVIGSRIIPLEEPLMNVGRSLENHITIDDPHVSRHHAQIRLRFGRYTLFDNKSRGGTFVNDVLVRQHTLQAGDVIRMGQTRLLYLEDDETEQTDHNPPPTRQDHDLS